MSLQMLKKVAVLALMMALAACGRTTIEVGDVPATQYQHVWITIKEIRLHKDDHAKLADAGWQAIALATPVSIDLLQLGNGNLASAFDQQIAAGTYAQVRLFLVDPSAALTDSANREGLTYNDQVQFQNDRGNSEIRQLELIAPNDGIRLAGSVKTARGSSVSSGTVSEIALLFDSRHDVLRFDYAGVPGFLLNPHVQATDLSAAGAISGQLDLSAVAPTDLLVQAEALSADGTYNTVVGATSVGADGRFLLYPLPLPADSSAATYDVVITGSGAQTVIVKAVSVSASTSSSTLTPTQIQSSTIPLAATTTFATNVRSDSPLSPTGTTLRFYQTLPNTGEVPYEIVARSAEPFLGIFFDDLTLGAGMIQSGTYNAGGDIAFATVTPQEGAGAFQVFAEAAGYARKAAPLLSGSNVTGTLTFTVPELDVESDATALTLSGTVTQSQGGFDAGYLLVTRDGRIVTSLQLDSILAQNGGRGGQYAIPNIPGGSSRNEFRPAVYSLYARVWNSSDPERTLTRISFATPVDLSVGNPGTIDLTLR